ncbi:MAG TPA: molybdopterin-binding protein, partial [Polyangiaceae bacterium]|nr:molybdopterin-binding protein [Polyangiaceae bacterium]
MQNVVETAAFLAIGNELLSGKVVEANLAPLAKTLRALGIELTSAEILLDDVPTLAAAILRLSAAHGILVTSVGTSSSKISAEVSSTT